MRLLLLSILFVISSCSEWKKVDREALIRGSEFENLIQADDNVVEGRLNLDTNESTFFITDFEPDRFIKFDQYAQNQSWCILNHNKNERIYLLKASESYVSAELIYLKYYDDKKLYVQLSNL